MADISEVTSDSSGSVTPTSSDENKEENLNLKINENALSWTRHGSKKCALLLFRPESLITKDKRLKSIGEKYRLAYKMVKTESKLVRSVLATYGFHEVHSNSADFNLMWTGAHLKPFSLRSLQDFQKVNHFPRSYEITRKDRLYKNIERMAHTKGVKHFDFIPKSFIMPSEYPEFCAVYAKEKGSWIVKPIASSRGRGIYLINNPNQIPPDDHIMVCKYISNPLLIDGFKFDVRVYVAITSYDPLLIYLFEEGLTRFATVKYEKANRNLKNQMMHLTNYSINKKSLDYVRCEDPDVEDYGNKWSMSAMLRYLKQEGIDTSSLMSRIEAVLIKSILAAELPIATACKMFVPHRENCIELYGFDILIDENLKPWILEGNLSPSLACDAPLDLKIKSSMIADFFSLAGLRCVDPQSRKQSKNQTDPLQRPVSAQRSSSFIGNAMNRSGKRPSSAGNKNPPPPPNKGGLSPEESRVLNMVKEQYQRRGNFVRIFPTVQTWELYGSFLEYKTNMNVMLSQKLFVRAKQIHGAYSSAVARMRRISAGQMLESRCNAAAERFVQYERKLFSLDLRQTRRRRSSAAPRRTKPRTPIGIDNKPRKQSSHLSSQSSSEEEEVEEEEDEEDNAATSERKSSEISAKSQQSLSSGDAAMVKSAKPDLTASTDGDDQMKPCIDGRSNKSERTASTASRSSANKQNHSAESNSAFNKPAKSVTVTRSKPVQRVYLYKAGSPVGSRSSSSERTSDSDFDSVPTQRSQQESKTPSGWFTSGSRSASSSTVQELSKDLTQKKPSLQQHDTSNDPRIKNIQVLQILRAEGNLRKLQARQAFSTYLSRVQHRLRKESENRVQESSDDVGKQEQQMELVLRFLKRAAGNLGQPFSVIVPSRRLSLFDRKRILAKQLGDFIRVYSKETDAMEEKEHIGSDKGQKIGEHSANGFVFISDADFRAFISNASEMVLEEVLTVYTHKNKSAAVFLGASKAKQSSSERKSDVSSAIAEKSKTSGAYSHSKTNSAVPTTVYSTSGLSSQVEENRAGISTERTQSSSATSLQQAAYIYSAKSAGLAPSSGSQKRPSSARQYTSSSSIHGASRSSTRPVSAANRPLGGSIHYQTAANQEAIVDALQKLTERQAARKYSASAQVTALSKHLSNLNQASTNSTQHHRIGAPDFRNVPQRTASLYDIAAADLSQQDAQRYERNSSALSSAQKQVEHFVQANSLEGLHFHSTQSMSQQSSTLLQQSRAKHQAMLAQKLEVWRAKLHSEMRVEQDLDRPEPCPSSCSKYDHIGQHRTCCQPSAGAIADEISCTEYADDDNDRGSFSGSENARSRDLLLLQRTEKLLNYGSNENPSALSTNQNFLRQVVKKSAKPSSSSSRKQAWPESCKTEDVSSKELTKTKPKHCSSSQKVSKSAKKTDKNSFSTHLTAVRSDPAFANAHRAPEKIRNIFFYESILREVNSLFKMGELPSQQVKVACTCKRNDK